MTIPNTEERIDARRRLLATVERKLTPESLARFERTRDQVMGDRRLPVNSTELLREIRAGEPLHADHAGADAS